MILHTHTHTSCTRMLIVMLCYYFVSLIILLIVVTANISYEKPNNYANIQTLEFNVLFRRSESNE